MRIVLIILLFALTTQAQNVWYVDANATGANTGRSWIDAWNYFDSSAWAGTGGINWSIIGSGDTIYVSGGTDTTFYTPQLGDNNTYGLWISPAVAVTVPGNPAVVTPAWHEGHNGKVIIATTTANEQNLLRIRNVANIKFVDLTFMDFRTVNRTGLVSIGDDSNQDIDYTDNIHIDRCTFLGASFGSLLHLEGDGMIVSNSWFEQPLSEEPADSDPITTFFCGDLLIENNVIIQRNINIGTDAHRDMIQMGYFNKGTTAEVVIRNNLILQIGNGSSWNAGIYSSIALLDTMKWYVYNNLILSTTDTSSIGGVFLYNSEGGSQNYWLFNNTIIVNSPASGLTMPISTGSNTYTDTVVYKNNLIVTDAPVNYMFSVPIKFLGDYYRKIDYNGWFEYGGLSGDFMPGNGFGAWTYAQWQADDPENDANSITGDSDTVTFANKYGVAFEDYYTTTGRGLGVNLADEHPEIVAKFPDIMYDALGNPRPEEGDWDMGALQFIDSEEPDTIPNTFTFTPVTNATRNTVYNSNTNTLAGIDEGESCTIWIVDGEYQINSGSWTSSPGAISLGDDFRVRRTSSSSYSTAVTCTLYISTRSAVFTITTEAEPPPPPPSPVKQLTSGGKRLVANGKRLVVEVEVEE